MDGDTLVERVARAIREAPFTHDAMARAALREIVAAAGGEAVLHECANAMVDEFSEFYPAVTSTTALLRALAEGGKA